MGAVPFVSSDSLQLHGNQSTLAESEMYIKIIDRKYGSAVVIQADSATFALSANQRVHSYPTSQSELIRWQIRVSQIAHLAFALQIVECSTSHFAVL